MNFWEKVVSLWRQTESGMKLKPLGKKLALYRALVVAGLVGLAVSFHFDWVGVFWVCVLCVIWCGARVCDIALDANFAKYGLWGYRCGPDLLVEYEPGDVEFEREKVWQSDTLEVNIDVEVTTKGNQE